MKLEQQVSSLELAQKLKELGVKQESYFVWLKVTDGHKLVPSYILRLDGAEEWCSAFTVAELGEMLPIITASWKGGLGKWTCEVPPQMECHVEYAETEADARAKMLIYLAEKGLIDPKKI